MPTMSASGADVGYKIAMIEVDLNDQIGFSGLARAATEATSWLPCTPADCYRSRRSRSTGKCQNKELR